MHQAQVTECGQAPKYVSAGHLPPPEEGELRVKVKYAGLHRVVRSRAAGSHYSAGPLPHIPGIDGIGTTKDGRTVYFFSFATGTYSEDINIPERAVFELPEGLDPVTTAATVNPATSSWMAFRTRVSAGVKPGFTVLILGATSASGRLAAIFAKELGAGHVIGAARNEAAMKDIPQLDERIVIAEKVEDTDFSTVGDVDVIIDYVYGPLTLHLFKALKSSRPTDYVHIGVLSGVMDIDVPGAILRSKDIALRGSGVGAWTMSDVGAQMPEMLKALKQVPKQPVKVVKLSEVEAEWKTQSKERVVFEV